jgi:Uma2 family endonuclease
MDTIEYEALSEEEYRRFEAHSQVRHEYVSGEVFAMTGGSLGHNTIVGNLVAALLNHLRDSPCSVFVHEVRLRVAKAHAFYYPDLLVTCASNVRPLDMSATQLDDAVLVVEVLSASTEATDRREKLVAYRTLPSLAEYLLVSQDFAHVQIHRRRGDIAWERIEYSGFETIHLATIALDLDMREVYEGVPVEAPPRSPDEA